jgi:regulator of protease activity HflC (stomatin/prohibitin superfamily)
MSDAIKPRVPISGATIVRGLFGLLGRILRSRIFWIAFAPILVVYCGAHWCTTYVPPYMRGVKQVYYGSSAGIKPETYGPGLYFVMPGIEQLLLLPHGLQVLNFSDSPSEVSETQQTAPAVQLHTSDGYSVGLDVSILYRIEDPYKVLNPPGPGYNFEALVARTAELALRQTLGELNAEQFYSGPKRIEKSHAAQQQLTDDLKPYGMVVVAVLVRRYIYDQKYQALIEGRKVKDQTVFWRQAEAQAEVEKRLRDTAIAEGAAAAKTELQRGESEVVKLNAEGDLYRRKQDSAGELLVKTAEAQGKKMMSDALLTAGAENLVGLRMAEVLTGVRVLVLPSDGKDGVNPLDLGNLLNKLEVK